MLVGIDGRAANEEKRAGIGNYCCELVRAMQTLGGGDRFRVYLDRPARPDFPVNPANTEFRILPAGRLWTQRMLAAELRRDPPEVFFAPTMQIPLLCGCPRVGTVHDLAFFDFGRHFTRRQRTFARLQTRLAVRSSARWIAVSQSTADDLIARLGVPRERVSVTPEGVSPSFRSAVLKSESESVRAKYALDAPYLLYVGRIQPRKNIARLIEAFAALQTEQPGLPHQLIIAGDAGWMTSGTHEAAERSSARDAIRFLGFIPEEDLPPLIACADTLALISLWEGFGLPVVEAMACGTPVVTSNCSSLPEVAGDAALLVDPCNVSAIRDALKRLLTDPVLREELSNKGLERSKAFTWENTARLTMEALAKASAFKLQD